VPISSLSNPRHRWELTIINQYRVKALSINSRLVDSLNMFTYQRLSETWTCISSIYSRKNDKPQLENDFFDPITLKAIIDNNSTECIEKIWIFNIRWDQSLQRKICPRVSRKVRGQESKT
jgi:hypothetical protein